MPEKRRTVQNLPRSDDSLDVTVETPDTAAEDNQVTDPNAESWEWLRTETVAIDSIDQGYQILVTLKATCDKSDVVALRHFPQDSEFTSNNPLHRGPPALTHKLWHTKQVPVVGNGNGLRVCVTIT